MGYAMIAYADSIAYARLKTELEALRACHRDTVSALGETVKALKDALELAEDAIGYKGDFLVAKHGDREELARLQKILEKV